MGGRKMYQFFRSRHPDPGEKWTDAEIFRLMVVSRFRALPNHTQEQYLLSECDTVQGLFGLVIEILKIEASRPDSLDVHGLARGKRVHVVSEPEQTGLELILVARPDVVFVVLEREARAERGILLEPFDWSDHEGTNQFCSQQKESSVDESPPKCIRVEGVDSCTSPPAWPA